MDDKRIDLENMVVYGSKEAVVQNPEDAGCPEEKQIDCLDYPVYQIRRF